MDEKSKEHINILIGKRLRLSRSLQGISHRELSERTGICSSIIALYEEGFGNISQKELQSFAKALEVPIEYFYHDDRLYKNLTRH